MRATVSVEGGEDGNIVATTPTFLADLSVQATRSHCELCDDVIVNLATLTVHLDESPSERLVAELSDVVEKAPHLDRLTICVKNDCKDQ